ncbi:hypothetical protein [Streptomyces violascens]|uniref:hypothetical protein n=1 Tax=Streptomyces violascens TaxID=67381 RepID=UPI0036C72418
MVDTQRAQPWGTHEQGIGCSPVRVIVTAFVAQLPCGDGCLRGASDGLQTDIAQSHSGICPMPTAQGESTTMNLITGLLAGVLHFIGWLV